MNKNGSVYIGVQHQEIITRLQELLGASSEGEAVVMVAEEIASDARDSGIDRLTRRHVGIKHFRVLPDA